MSKIPTRTQVSAGGVAYRLRDAQVEVAIVSVGDKARWQLPKGLVEPDEAPEAAALREVREEAGLETELVGPIERIEYWYYGADRGQRVRFHKFVHFYLLRSVAGDVAAHDREVNEARWIEIGRAREVLAFASERQVVARAAEMIRAQ